MSDPNAGRSNITLTALVLRTQDVERARAFYRALGIDLVTEQHGTGPIHYAATLRHGLLLEIYPAGAATVLGALRLSFAVPDPLALAQSMHEAGLLAAPPKMRQSSATVMDPDGNTIELTERTE